MELPDWVAVGAEVGTMTSGEGEIAYTAVKRINKTEVVLANGTRLRLRDMKPVRGGVEAGLLFSNATRGMFLYPAAVARRAHGVRLLDEVARVASRASRYDGSKASDALDAVQTAIDEARQKLANLNLLSNPAERRLADEHGGLVATHPSAFDAPPVRTYADGSQAYGPYA